MRAIKIDSENKTVNEMEIEDNNSLKGMQDVVCGSIERAHSLENGDTVFVNEEGLLCSPEHFFEIQGAHQPFAGNAIVVGFSPTDGKTISAESSLSDIKAKVKFLSLADVRRQYQT